MQRPSGRRERGGQIQRCCESRDLHAGGACERRVGPLVFLVFLTVLGSEAPGKELLSLLRE